MKLLSYLNKVLPMALFVTSLALISYAQNICPVIKHRLPLAVGSVIEIGGEEKPVPDTTVELFAMGDEDVFVASTKTDKKGWFAFGGIKKGDYRVVVHFIVNGEKVAPEFDFVLKITRTNAMKSKKRLLVTLGPECFRSSVTIEDAEF